MIYWLITHTLPRLVRDSSRGSCVPGCILWLFPVGSGCYLTVAVTVVVRLVCYFVTRIFGCFPAFITPRLPSTFGLFCHTPLPFATVFHALPCPRHAPATFLFTGCDGCARAATHLLQRTYGLPRMQVTGAFRYPVLVAYVGSRYTVWLVAMVVAGWFVALRPRTFFFFAHAPPAAFFFITLTTRRDYTRYTRRFCRLYAHTHVACVTVGWRTTGSARRTRYYAACTRFCDSFVLVPVPAHTYDPPVIAHPYIPVILHSRLFPYVLPGCVLLPRLHAYALPFCCLPLVHMVTVRGLPHVRLVGLHVYRVVAHLRRLPFCIYYIYAVVVTLPRSLRGLHARRLHGYVCTHGCTGLLVCGFYTAVYVCCVYGYTICAFTRYPHTCCVLTPAALRLRGLFYVAVTHVCTCCWFGYRFLHLPSRLVTRLDTFRC